VRHLLNSLLPERSAMAAELQMAKRAERWARPATRLELQAVV
jgi:hypothetical protein